MALIVADRVQETTNTTGTGTLTLAGAVSGYQSFGAIGDANTTYYTIVSGTNWETGIGTYTASGTTLSRNTVLASSAGGTTKISVVSGAVVFCDYPAGKAVYEDANGVITGYPISGGTIDNTVIGGTTPAAGTFTTITGQTEVLKGTGSNLLTQSNGFNTYNTNGSSVTVTGGQSDPFGGSTAFLVVPTASAVQHTLYNVTNPYSALTSPYTISVYVKASGYTLFYISDIGSTAFACSYNLSTVTATPFVGCTGTITAVAGASGWYRVTLTTTVAPSAASRFSIVGYPAGATITGYGATFTGDGTSGVVVYGAQVEFGSTAGTYIPTTTTAVYGTPSLSFSGVAGLGLQSDGSLYVQPAGTGALQAQATTSTATGGNARGANAVDWQTSRTTAAQVASSQYGIIGGGLNNTSSGFVSTITGGSGNTASNSYATIGGGFANTASGFLSEIVGGQLNTAGGYLNFIGGGFTNSGTSGSTATTQTTTIAVTASTTFYLSATNASIKVGQYITGTGVTANTYATSTVTTGTAAVMNTSTISGTTLTVGSLASGTIIAGQVLTGTGVTAGTYIVSGSGLSWTVSASQTVASTTITGTAYTFTISQAATTAAGVTLSFYTPHGVVVGGGNNQATGAYSFIGGGGDAGTAANRNVASGDWSFVGGGIKNIASGTSSVVAGGGITSAGAVGTNTASGTSSVISGGYSNTSSGTGSVVSGGTGNNSAGTGSVVLGGSNNQANANYSTITGNWGTARQIVGYTVFSTNAPIAGVAGINQAALLVLARETTDATATVLTSNTSAASGTNQVILPNNSAYTYKATGISTAQFVLATTTATSAAGTSTITFATQTAAPFYVGQTIVVAGVTPSGFNGTKVVTACTVTSVSFSGATAGPQTVAGTITGTSFTKSWKIEGAIMRSSSAAGTRLVGSPTTTVLAQDTDASAWTLVATADTTNGGLQFTFTGAAGTTIRTVVKVDTTEVTY